MDRDRKTPLSKSKRRPKVTSHWNHSAATTGREVIPIGRTSGRAHGFSAVRRNDRRASR